MTISTKVALAKRDTKSLKTTIPEAIVEYLQLEGKDELEWQMGMKDNEPVALVRKITGGDVPKNFDEDVMVYRRQPKVDG